MQHLFEYTVFLKNFPQIWVHADSLNSPLDKSEWCIQIRLKWGNNTYKYAVLATQIVYKCSWSMYFIWIYCFTFGQWITSEVPKLLSSLYLNLYNLYNNKLPHTDTVSWKGQNTLGQNLGIWLGVNKCRLVIGWGPGQTGISQFYQPIILPFICPDIPFAVEGKSKQYQVLWDELVGQCPFQIKP